MPEPLEPHERTARTKINRWVRIGITTAVVVTAIVLSIWAYRFYEYSPWTRDGRVRVYVVDTAPEVSGLVIEVPVADNQLVHKGDLLYRIDPRDYRAAVKRAQAALDGARQQLALQQENARRRVRLRAGDVSDEEKQTYAINAGIASANVDAAEAALYKAKIDLERCEVRSTVNGWVTNLAVRAGNYADAGRRQMSVVDAAPDAQGLPQVNPIFTWVRLAQRIPVRLHIDRVPPEVHLAAGETCTVDIDRK